MTMATSLPTAVMLSGLPDEEVKDVLSTNSGFYNPEILFINVLKANKPLPPGGLNEASKPNQNQKASDSLHKLGKEDDSYYLEVADVLEKQFFGPISPPKIKKNEYNDEYQSGIKKEILSETSSTKIDSDGDTTYLPKKNFGPIARPYSTKIAEKCRGSSEVTKETLTFVCDVIDELEQKFEDLQKKKQREKKINESKIMYQNTDILDLYNKEYKLWNFAEPPSNEQTDKKSRLNSNEIISHLMLPCSSPGCYYQEPYSL